MRNGLSVKHRTSPQLCNVTWATLVHTVMFNFYDLFVCFSNSIKSNCHGSNGFLYAEITLLEQNKTKQPLEDYCPVHIFEKLSPATAAKGAQEHFTSTNPLEWFSIVTHLMFAFTSLQIIKCRNFPEDWLVHSLCNIVINKDNYSNSPVNRTRSYFHQPLHLCLTSLSKTNLISFLYSAALQAVTFVLGHGHCEHKPKEDAGVEVCSSYFQQLLCLMLAKCVQLKGYGSKAVRSIQAVAAILLLHKALQTSLTFR